MELQIAGHALQKGLAASRSSSWQLVRPLVALAPLPGTSGSGSASSSVAGEVGASFVEPILLADLL